MKNFSIYRASAGSGKTYLLTYNYIKLALQHPDNFKSILAVTFTNKAMEEMKSRIVKTLKELSDGQHSMTFDLMADLGINETALSRRCADLVTAILHNYSFFAVSTIDTFFQKVVRSFAREMGIHSGFKIELDQTKVLSEVIDQLVADMGDDKQLISWLTDFAIHQIGQGKNWDTKRQIKQLSGELFKEEVVLQKSTLFAQLEDDSFMPSFVKSVFDKKATFEKELIALAEAAKVKMQHFGLTAEDFTQKGRGVGGYVDKTTAGEVSKPNSYVLAALSDGKWASPKSDTFSQVESALAVGLDLAVANLVSYYNDHVKAYNSLQQVANYLYTFGLLSRVHEALQEYKNENELLLISDFPVFLNEIIHDSDSPFVYEKIGNRYRHFLIDEFQDTSGLQWNNFKPLIKDSISEGQFNMVVGDIKQSIYRWRAGNWKILLDQIKNDIGENYSDEKSLDTNHRSKQVIVEFNNDLFAKAPELLEKSLGKKIASEGIDFKLQRAYQNATQNPADQSGDGWVDLAFINKKEIDNADEMVINRLVENLQSLQNHNYELRDITILVRTNTEGRKISQALMEYQSENPDEKYRYDTISNETLFIRKNPAVHLLLQCFQLAVDPSEDLYVEQLRYAFNHYSDSSSDESLVDTFVDFTVNNRNHSVSFIMDEAFAHFHLFDQSKDVAYLMAFQDSVLDFLQYESDSLSEFLVWWADHQNRSIQMSGDANAINIMTVHKSKGLQFKAVIIPFCNWALDHKGGFTEQMLWCNTNKHEELSAVPMLPMRYSSAMAETIFAEEYFVEKHDIFLDNLNLLYVALTRAEEVLLVTSTYTPAFNGANTVGDLLHDYCDEQESFEASEDDIQKLVIGQMGEYSTGEPEMLEGIALVPNTSHVNIDQRLKFRTSKHIMDEAQQRSIDYGEIVHWVFSRIKIKQDFRQALDQAVKKFALIPEELEEIKVLLREVWELPEVSNWFDEKWKVKNESSILMENGRIKRPDRVIYEGDTALVIDYKTGKPAESHMNQVRNYKGLLSKMGYKRVEGYLLYLNSKTVQVI